MRALLLSALFLIFFAQSPMAQLQSPEEFLGYEPGTEFSRHADVVRYFDHVAQGSPLVTYHTYGSTHERRALTYAIITSRENMKDLESIRRRHLATTGLEQAELPADKAIVWLSYNVHGNEASSTEAAMKTLYSLITEHQDYLENVVIIMDPCVNPDGRDRYANWFNQVRTIPFDPSQEAAEHHEPWPGGRPNHYLFDLNRDWAWATQVETRQRLKIYNQWLPHIHVDFHEQGINEPYYFAPAAEPFHQIITPFQRDFQTRIGRNHARYFDREGWLFFTRERFDLLYPSYGDTYPTYMGAIGMTYEQAGHGRAGLGITTDEGFELSLKDRILHHHTTGLSTIEVAARGVEALTEEFSKFFSSSEMKHTAYALKGHPDKINALTILLDHHGISYGTTGEEKIRGFRYSTGKEGELAPDENTLVIPTDQPKGKMVEVLFEPTTTLVDSLTYDITAWSLPYAYGLEAVATTRKISLKELPKRTAVNNTPAPSGAGYIAQWHAMEDARFLAALLREGIRVRFSELPFEHEDQEFARGSLIITKSDNSHSADFDQRLINIANQFNRVLYPATTGFASSGPDFGSPRMRLINPPRVGVLRGKSISSLNYGEVWYFFEQELGYPLTALNRDYFQKINLEEYDVLIFPEGQYSDFLDRTLLDKVKAWLGNGGKLIALGRAAGAFAGKEGFTLKEKTAVQDSLNSPELIPYARREREAVKEMITGSILHTKLDDTHPLAFGFQDSYHSLKLHNQSYSYLPKGYNVAYLEEPEIIAGFAGSTAKETLGNSLIFGEERLGRGSMIYMVDNPLFRAFWENGKLFFANAVFLVNNKRFRQ